MNCTTRVVLAALVVVCLATVLGACDASDLFRCEAGADQSYGALICAQLNLVGLAAGLVGLLLALAAGAAGAG
jgi:hypothetical protein